MRIVITADLHYRPAEHHRYVGICGMMGWYDYLTSPAHLAVPTDVCPLLKELVNHDADYIDSVYWTKSQTGR
jgi:hypothetical protein